MKINKYKTEYNIHKGGFNILFGYKRFNIFQCWAKYPHSFKKLCDAVSFGNRNIGRTLRIPVKSNFNIILEIVIVLLILTFFVYGITNC